MRTEILGIFSFRIKSNQDYIQGYPLKDLVAYPSFFGRTSCMIWVAIAIGVMEINNKNLWDVFRQFRHSYFGFIFSQFKIFPLFPCNFIQSCCKDSIAYQDCYSAKETPTKLSCRLDKLDIPLTFNFNCPKL